MMHPWKLSVAALAVTCVVLGNQAWAFGWFQGGLAEKISERCVNQTTALADRCAENNAKLADDCAKVIRGLLRMHCYALAEKQADACIALINRSSDACVKTIESTCKGCVCTLKLLHACGLIDQVNAACEEATDCVRQSQADAVETIDGAFQCQPTG